MSLLPSKPLPERSISSESIPLLPAKAYVPPPSSAQSSSESGNTLIDDAHIGHEAMPIEDEIKDATTERRFSTSIGVVSGFASSKQ